MPFNGVGVFAPPSPEYPAVSGASIKSAYRNTIDADFSTGLTNCVTRDGQSPALANLPMATFKITGLGAGTTSGDSLRWQQLFSQGVEADIASVATCDIGAQNTNFLRVTGTTGITSFGTNYNGPRFLRFAGIVTLTNSANLILPNSTNLTTFAGFTCVAIPLSGVGWYVITGYAGGQISSNAYTVPVTVTFSGTPTFDASKSNVFYLSTSLTANITTFTISNPSDGQTISIRFTQDATGSRTVTPPASVKVAGSVDPTASRTSWMTLTYVSSVSRWEGAWTAINA